MAGADTTLTIWGLGHLAGATVGACVAGVYMGTYTVAADGSIDVLYGADSDGTVTAAYLVANFPTSGGTLAGSDHDVVFDLWDGSSIVSITVPILVGLLYTAYGQLVRPMLPEALYGGKGPTLGKMRRGQEYALMVEGAKEVSVGTSTSNLTAATMTTDGMGTPELTLAGDEVFTGVMTQPLADGPSYDTQLMWRSTQPYRLTVSMAAVFQEGEG